MGPKRTRKGSVLAKNVNASTASKTRKFFVPVALSLLLVVVTLVLYSPVRGHDFINYDDGDYVVNNSHIKMGLSWETLRWSLTSREAANWFPVTWWSHALDYELFGLDAGSHHFTNVIIHVLNAMLVFLLLNAATKATTRSFMVAALFAWHPFNVESVAWVAERKNVLCALFFFLTLAAYGWYARKPRATALVVVFGAFLLALASKPMAVTLPFVLLLLDYWPLQRVAGWTKTGFESSIPQQTIWRLLAEKLPLFALSAASSCITVWAQSSGALRSIKTFPFGARLENALYSYAAYLAKTFWLFRFGLFYPHLGTSFPLSKALLAGALLGATAIAVWMQRSIRSYLIVGWLWFLGVLFPMIGIVQVGDQAMADRYAYLSTIGLFVMAVWLAFEALDGLNAGIAARRVVAIIILVGICFVTRRQISYWEDSVAVWSHTLEVTTANPLAEDKLALALLARGNDDEAIVHFVNATNLDSRDVGARVNLGAYYAAHGRLQDAIEEFQSAVDLTNDRNLSVEDKRYRCSALLDLGFAYTLTKDYRKALMNLQAAKQTEPSVVDRTEKAIASSLANARSEDGYLKLSLLLRAQGRNDEASGTLQEATRANPQFKRARELLDFLNTNF